MKKMLNDSELLQTISSFRLPRYHELPNMGLYLEQTTNYMNQCLAPLGCITVTNSMIRNYVKMGIVRNPVKKQYDANHILHSDNSLNGHIEPSFLLDFLDRVFRYRDIHITPTARQRPLAVSLVDQ